jgi:predicted Zn-dependent protease
MEYRDPSKRGRWIVIAGVVLALAAGGAAFYLINQAQQQFEASLELDPRSEWAHYYYGTTLEQKGETEAAAREYRRVLELNPEFASGYHRLGLLYKQQGRMAEAKQAMATRGRRHYDGSQSLCPSEEHPR